MAIQGEYRIAAPQQKVWEALNDPAVLQACVPGCESLQMVSATDIEARVVAQLGPVKAAFTTKIVLSDLNPPSGYTLTGEGKAAVGFWQGQRDRPTGARRRHDGLALYRHVVPRRQIGASRITPGRVGDAPTGGPIF